jgi:hypothetical protein
MQIYLIIVLSICVIYGVLKIESYRNHKIGNIGEKIVVAKLNELSGDYYVKHNVHLSGTQIDHLVVCDELKLCFVIETKLWGGIITGDSNDKFWRQEKNGMVKYLKNPILQNKYHCRVVRNYYKGYRVYNVIVFVRNQSVPKYRCIMDEHELVGYIIRTSSDAASKVSNSIPIERKTEWLSRNL